MELRNAYKQKMEAQLKEWSAQINLLEAKLDKFSAEMRVKRAEELHALRARQHAAAEKIKELEKSTGDAWNQTRATADKMWEDLKASLSDVKNKFK